MEGQDGKQEPHLVLAHKIFLLTHSDVEDIDKVRLRDEVVSAVRSLDMDSLYETLASDSLIERDQGLLDEMRKRNEEEVKKLDEKLYIMPKIKTPKSQRAARALEKRAPKLVENNKKTLILHGTKTSGVLNDVLTQVYHLKRGSAVKYTKKNKEIRPFESGGETSLEFYSLKSDCSLFVFGSHSKKRPNNLVLGRMYDHHVYDLVEVGVENLKPMESFVYDKKLSPKIGSKPFFAFIGEGFESVEELKHLKEVLLDLFRGEVVENLNLAGVDRVYVCTAISPTTVFFTHCALRLKRSGTTIPRMELVEVGPSMDFVVRRHCLPNDSLKKEAMKTASQQSKKVKNVGRDVVQGKIGKIYMPDQQVGGMALSNDIKGLKRQRREAKMKISAKEDEAKKRKTDSQ